jgi:CubicO group peptidase (beta-lactamase class C family)
MLQKGEWNGKQLLSKNYINESLSPAMHLKTGKRSVDFYGYQWGMFKYEGMDVKFARGLLGQYIMIIPEKDLVIVRLGHHRSKTYTKGIPSDIYMWVEIALEMI